MGRDQPGAAGSSPAPTPRPLPPWTRSFPGSCCGRWCAISQRNSAAGGCGRRGRGSRSSRAFTPPPPAGRGLPPRPPRQRRSQPGSSARLRAVLPAPAQGSALPAAGAERPRHWPTIKGFGPAASRPTSPLFTFTCLPRHPPQPFAPSKHTWFISALRMWMMV